MLLVKESYFTGFATCPCVTYFSLHSFGFRVVSPYAAKLFKNSFLLFVWHDLA